MVGVITGREVALNAALVVRLFGWRVLGRCAIAVMLQQRVTFLSLTSKLHQRSE